MPSEFGPTNIIPKQQSLETLKETYKQRLNAILYEQLTVENIETFADEALSNMVQLTEDILNESKKNPEFEFNPSLDKKTQEDEACKILGLPDVQETLQSIIDKKDEINSLKIYIHKNAENINKVITPPQENFKVKIEEGDGSFREKKIFPRLLTLLYILQNDFEIEPENIPIKEGITTSKMMRQTSYARVEISDLERVVYICDEEGNASYLFDAKKLTEQKITLEKLDLDDKEVKNSLILKYPGIGVRLIQSKNWRENVTELLGGEISERQKEENQSAKKEKKSEFKKERKEFLSFEDFQNEVRNLYKGQENIKKWYEEERKNHSNWPVIPHQTYKDKGWEGLQELVGLERKKFLSFEDFRNEVMKLYPGRVNVHLWFRKEQKNHPSWPSGPDMTYKNKGWKGWMELVKKEENPFLVFENFKIEAKNIYPGYGNVNEWYKEEQKKHFNWPTDPSKFYKHRGWVGWPEMVGKENKFKKTFLSFDDFKNEVKNESAGVKGLEKWFRKEQKNHPNWPARPQEIYKNKGWEGWLKLIGVEKKEFLTYYNFQNEVKNLYKGEKNIWEWYKKEQKSHPNWPVAPYQTYKDKGWQSWAELVSKKKRNKNI